MIFQQPVIDLVDVGKIVDRLSGRILIVQSDFVVKNRVEADVLESRSLLDRAEIAAVTVAQRQDGSPRPEHLLPVMRKGVAGSLKIDFNFFFRRLRANKCGLEKGEGKQQD